MYRLPKLDFTCWGQYWDADIRVVLKLNSWMEVDKETLVGEALSGNGKDWKREKYVWEGEQKLPGMMEPVKRRKEQIAAGE